jgi:hypothetical protein
LTQSSTEDFYTKPTCRMKPPSVRGGTSWAEATQTGGPVPSPIWNDRRGAVRRHRHPRVLWMQAPPVVVMFPNHQSPNLRRARLVAPNNRGASRRHARNARVESLSRAAAAFARAAVASVRSAIASILQFFSSRRCCGHCCSCHCCCCRTRQHEPPFRVVGMGSLPRARSPPPAPRPPPKGKGKGKGKGRGRGTGNAPGKGGKGRGKGTAGTGETPGRGRGKGTGKTLDLSSLFFDGTPFTPIVRNYPFHDPLQHGEEMPLTQSSTEAGSSRG